MADALTSYKSSFGTKSNLQLWTGRLAGWLAGWLAGCMVIVVSCHLNAEIMIEYNTNFFDRCTIWTQYTGCLGHFYQVSPHKTGPYRSDTLLTGYFSSFNFTIWWNIKIKNNPLSPSLFDNLEPFPVALNWLACFRVMWRPDFLGTTTEHFSHFLHWTFGLGFIPWR